MKRRISPYGAWTSPINANDVASSTVRLQQLMLDHDYLYWLERLPEYDGKQVIKRISLCDKNIDIPIPPDFNVRSRVHEYGGGDYIVNDNVIYFINNQDQCIYQQHPGYYPKPITFTSDRKSAILKYADMVIAPDKKNLICVREVCENERVVKTEVISIELREPFNQYVLLSGNGFYTSPRISPDSRQLAWISWQQPHMPWDETQLWIANLIDFKSLGSFCCIAGGNNVSIAEPQWNSKGILYFISDETGWYNLYFYNNNIISNVISQAAEFSQPQWFLGNKCYAFLPNGLIASIITKKGKKIIALTSGQKHIELKLPWCEYEPSLHAAGDNLFFIAADTRSHYSLIKYNISSMKSNILYTTINYKSKSKYFSIPKHISFISSHNETVYANYYPPVNPLYSAPPNELPPLIVICHGGPTFAAKKALNMEIQFYTSRGFAIVDVNYSGSSGYGKKYRDRIKGYWGEKDVQDCIDAAKYLSMNKIVDANRLLIKGSSAGGFTALCALTFHKSFHGASIHYGISDLELLLKETHKFESHYPFQLIGKYPENKSLYHKRSPINFANKLTTSIIFFHGREDKVVPPSQVVKMGNIISNQGSYCKLIIFDGEHHGFQKKSSIICIMKEEYKFFLKVLNISL